MAGAQNPQTDFALQVSQAKLSIERFSDLVSVPIKAEVHDSDSAVNFGVEFV